MRMHANAYTMTKGDGCSPLHARLDVYEEETFLGKRLFAEGCLSIGSSHKADILLNHPSVQAIHAVVRVDGRRLILKNNYPEDGLRVNGLSVDSVPLKSQDVIRIGPFDLFVAIDKCNPNPGAAPDVNASEAAETGGAEGPVSKGACSPATRQTCKLMLVDNYPSQAARSLAARTLSGFIKKDAKTCLDLINRKRFVVRTGLDRNTARQWQNKLRAAGISCLVKEYVPKPRPKPPVLIPESLLDAVCDDAPVAEKRPEEPVQPSERAQPLFRFSAGVDIDEDEEEDALWVAPFSLKSKLDASTQATLVSKDVHRQLAVTKTTGHTVADVTHVAKGKKYRVPLSKGSHTLVQYTAKGIGYVFFTRSMGGYIRHADNSTVDLDRLKLDDHLYKPKKELYRIAVPDDAIVVIVDGDTVFTVGYAAMAPWADVKESILPQSFTCRHWAVSFGFHLAIVLIAAMVYFSQSTGPVKEPAHFVKIDPSMLQQLEMKKVETPKAEKTPPPPKPAPRKIVDKPRPIKKQAKPRPTRKTASSQKSKNKVAKAASPSKHPKAGGGFGEGNIKNRDVNQTGLLSMLGNSEISGSSKAIASITNLDAVPSAGASKKNYTVGGIKGSLGSANIAVSNDAIVQTKGSSQVLRSAGASGPGRVAALQKGKTGKKQVQALVSAKMTRNVKIQGGMSREAVKRVIDQHLDDITRCYEIALLSNPSISGRVVFEWKILMSGRVGETNIVSSNINSHGIHTCIKAAIKSWQFPKPKGAEVVVSYPFVFDLVAF
jgi:outer membrane biosynthesis protein TonB